MARLMRARPFSVSMACSNSAGVNSLRSPALATFATGTRSVMRFSSKVTTTICSAIPAASTVSMPSSPSSFAKASSSAGRSHTSAMSSATKA